jgi:hypothetical protein
LLFLLISVAIKFVVIANILVAMASLIKYWHF